MTTESYVQAIGGKPDRAEEYHRHHAEPWLEVIAALRQANLHDDTIHRLPEAGFFVQWFSIASDDLAARFRRLSEQHEMQPWLRLMTGCQAPLNGYASWPPMREAYRLE